MHRLEGALQRYDWGSRTSIPELLGAQPDGRPWAELWFGTHPGGQTRLAGDGTLAAHIASDPVRALGEDVVRRFGPDLPFLVKVIAPGQPLSLQVHPDLVRAEERFAAEEARGVPRDAVERNYKDTNHKPEMVYALTRYEAVSGFRAPRRAAEVLAGLDSDLARRMRRTLRLNPTRFGIRQAFSDLVSADTRPSRQEVAELVEEVRRRHDAGQSPSPRVDANVLTMDAAFPGDPGVAASLLLNPVTLQPGEALFVPAGAVHAYISGLGIEIMASSDNVLRAGLTAKHVDVPEMLASVDYVAAPPVRPAPEYLSRATRAYYAPVDDFELLVTTVVPQDGRLQVPGRGPRVAIVVDGEVTLTSPVGQERLVRGQAVFVGAHERTLAVEGSGTVVLADVP